MYKYMFYMYLNIVYINIYNIFIVFNIYIYMKQ